MEIDFNTLKREEQVLLALRSVYEQFGYKKFKMGKFEEYSLYLENKSFLTSDNIITFNDLDGKLLALKPDVTLSIVKNAKDLKGEFEKLYYIENVYRIDKNTKKYKEISQMGLEAIGSVDDYTTIEIINLALVSLNEVDKNFVLDLSNVAFVTGLIDSLQLKDYSMREELFNCIASKNLHDLKQFADNNGFSEDAYNKLSNIITIDGDFSKAIIQAKAVVINDEMQRAIDELERIYEVFKGTEFENKIRLDFSILNDTNYYNGIIFQGYVSRVPNKILSGGRYDKLLERLGKNMSAIGFALYLDEIANYYQNKTQYDVDVVILYDKVANYAKLIKCIKDFNSKGYTVRAEKQVPEEIKYNRLFRFSENGLQEVENV